MYDQNIATFQNEFPDLIRDYSISLAESWVEFDKFTEWLSSKVDMYFSNRTKMVTLSKVNSP